jgi:hypothetical protein
MAVELLIAPEAERDIAEAYIRYEGPLTSICCGDARVRIACHHGVIRHSISRNV